MLGVQSYLKNHPHHEQPTRLADSVLGRLPDRDWGEGQAGLNSSRGQPLVEFQVAWH